MIWPYTDQAALTIEATGLSRVRLACIRGLQDVKGGRTLVKQAGTDVPSDHPRVF